MRNLKKFLAVVVAIAVMMTAMIPAFAAETTAAAKTDADICKNLKVLTGGTDGVTPEYLAKDTQRIQAAIILLRLMGKEAEAKAFDATGKETFKDAGLVQYAEGKNILAYLKAHPEYGFKGYTDGNFGVEDLIKPQQLYKVLLQAMGYAQDTDYKYAEIVTFAQGKGLAKIASLETLTNNDVAAGIVEAFKGTEKGGKTFIEKLIADKLITEAAAAAEGLITITAPTSATLKATGVKKLTVEFNAPADDTKATFAVKKGSIAYNVATKTWAADKKSVVLELASKIIEGEYTVTVSGIATSDITAKATALNEKVAKITFPSDKAVLVRENTKQVKLSYKLENQYGEDMTSGYASLTVSPSTGSSSYKDGTITVTGTSDFKADDKIALSILDTSSTTFGTQTFTITSNARVAEITIDKLYHADNKTLDTAATYGDFYLVMAAKDQFGNNLLCDGTKATTDVTYFNDDIAVSVSDTSIVKLATNGSATSSDKYAFNKKSIDGTDKLVLALDVPTTKKAGKATITMVSKTTGKLATFVVEVKDIAKVDTFTFTAPPVAAAGSDIEIPFEAYDQFGNKITDATTLKNGFSGVLPVPSVSQSGKSATLTFEQDYVKNTAKMKVTNNMTEKGSITFTLVTFTYKVVTIKIDVTDAKKPTLVSGTKDFVVNTLKTGVTQLDFADIIVKDQYNADFDLTKKLTLKNNNGAAGDVDNAYRLTVKSSDTAKVSFADDARNASLARTTAADVYVMDDKDVPLYVYGKGKGSATITVTLQVYKEATAWTDVDGSALAFTTKVAEVEDLKTVEVGTIGTVYDEDGAAGSKDRAQAVTVTGKTEDGTTYSVDNKFFFVNPTDSKMVTDVNNKVYVQTKGVVTATDKTTATVTVLVTVNAPNAAQRDFLKEVTVCKDAPAAASFTLDVGSKTYATVEDATANVISVAYNYLDGNANTLANTIASVIKVKDQYGYESFKAASAYTAFVITEYKNADGTAASMSNITTNATNTASFTNGTLVAGQTMKVAAIINGKTITMKVVVKPNA